MTKDEALRLAFEALEEITRRNQSDHQAEIAEEAITAIKAALEAKDEPVAWVNKERNTIMWDKLYPDMDALYTTPPQRTWVGLTDEEISASSKGHMTRNGFARAIEAKLKAKNT
jgi:hypothetical protein